MSARLLSQGLRRCQELFPRRCEGKCCTKYTNDNTFRWWWTLPPRGFLLLTTSCLTTVVTSTLMRITTRQGQGLFCSMFYQKFVDYNRNSFTNVEVLLRVMVKTFRCTNITSLKLLYLVLNFYSERRMETRFLLDQKY